MTTATEGSSLSVLDSWSSISEKTVFVLDRSHYFTHVSSGHSIDGDCMSKDPKKSSNLYEGQPVIQPFDRSLWTCTVEAVVGYSRLVWDLFTPDQRCISILAVSPNDEAIDRMAEPHHIERICSWQDGDQNLDKLLKSLAKRSYCHQIRPPNQLLKTNDISTYPNCNSDSVAILSTLDQALSDLAHLTSDQIEHRSSMSKNISGQTQMGTSDNNGRIILISSFQNQKAIDETINKFEEFLHRKNRSLKETIKQDSSTGNQLCPINYCDLIIVNTFPIMDDGPCSKIENFKAFRPFLHVKTYSVKSGRMIAGLLNNLCLQHHNLRSTTITGIPMKEEQNASSSSQYDVEIVHCSSIHKDILNSGSPLLEGVIEVIDRNGFPCDTFKLSWCTPRNTQVELNHCVATSRITAVDVNSRPSACLTNFVLNGRQVMLEICKSKSNRMTTHILASHDGELYIHSLATMQQKVNVNEPPAINDSLGGKVGDYRVNDFMAFMKQHTLTKSYVQDDPLNRTCNLIKRQTLYWPVSLGHTILLNVPNLLGGLLVRIPKVSMSQADVDECKKVIDNLIKFEKEAQALPSISIADLIKTSCYKSTSSRLEQLYKLLWNELEYFLRVHSTTPEHDVILDYLLERHGDKKFDGERGTKRSSKTSMATTSLKKQKVASRLIPEISEAANAPLQQTAMFYKTGFSLYQTWTQLYHLYHRSKSKLTFVGRQPQPQPQRQQQKQLLLQPQGDQPT